MQEIKAEGIDIMLLVDISGSMRATDFKPNRLEAVKVVAGNFVADRLSDRIGLNVFAAESFLQCPLTTDLQRLQEIIQSVTLIDERYDGTAIGLALAGGINRLRESDAKSRVMVLLSDGRNNAGELDPLTAAEMAKQFGIRIYTIGAGTRGSASIPVNTPLGTRTMQVQVDVDEETLEAIAESTGGRYYRATDETSLAEIYAEISQLETTEFEVNEYVRQRERFMWPLLLGLIFLTLEIVLDKTILRRFP
jgi:Ca-activated chloride channel family protein